MDETSRQLLLQLARETIRARLSDELLPPVPPGGPGPDEYGGVFVTLRRRGRLRGCMGRFQPTAGLYTTTQQMAVTVLQDPRFVHVPVVLSELPELRVEISVLSALRRTEDPLSLQPGVHGVYIKQGLRDGCFLPQVATEQGWNAEQLLSRCCEGKAGLAPDAWRDPATEISLFTAEVISEQP